MGRGARGRTGAAETALWRSHDDFLELYLIEHFEATDPVGAALARRRHAVAPRDLAGLRPDPAFVLILYRLDADRRRVIEMYDRGARALDRLIERLEMEVAR